MVPSTNLGRTVVKINSFFCICVFCPARRQGGMKGLIYHQQNVRVCLVSFTCTQTFSIFKQVLRLWSQNCQNSSKHSALHCFQKKHKNLLLVSLAWLSLSLSLYTFLLPPKKRLVASKGSGSTSGLSGSVWSLKARLSTSQSTASINEGDVLSSCYEAESRPNCRHTEPSVHGMKLVCKKCPWCRNQRNKHNICIHNTHRCKYKYVYIYISV